MEACKTASTCTPEEVQGTHVFDILGYRKHRGMGNGSRSYLRSKIFAVGGHDWVIRFYPDGYGNESQDYITVYLELLSKGTSRTILRASCDLRLVDQCTGIFVFSVQCIKLSLGFSAPIVPLRLLRILVSSKGGARSRIPHTSGVIA